MKVSLIYKPEERELMLCKRCVWVTMGKTEMPKVDLPNLVTNLHIKTSYAYVFIKGAKSEQHLQRGYAAMFEAISVAFCWIRENGYDPAEIMKTKHEYNRTRPYKHGGKVC